MRRNDLSSTLEDLSMHTNSRLRPMHQIFKSKLQLINCHSCKSIESENNMITCHKLSCRESFCINCVKKHELKFNSNSFANLKAREGMCNWKCYKCKKMCNCTSCAQELWKSAKKMLKRKRRRRRNKHNNNADLTTKGEWKVLQNNQTATHIEENKHSNLMQINNERVKNIVTIDQFKIYECADDTNKDGSLQNENEKEKEIKENHICHIPIIKQEDVALCNSEAIPSQKDNTFNNAVHNIHTDSSPARHSAAEKWSYKRSNKHCILCKKKTFPKGITLIKFRSNFEFLTYMKNHFKHMTSSCSNIFGENKNILEKLYETFDKKEKETFFPTRLRSNKRFCTSCIQNIIQEDNGLMALYDNLRDEDEQANLDENRKVEILNNMRNLICKQEDNSQKQACYKEEVGSGNVSGNKQINNSNNSFEMNFQGGDNIFNMIFKKSDLSPGTNKIEVNYSYNPNIYLDFKNIDLFKFESNPPCVNINPLPDIIQTESCSKPGRSSLSPLFEPCQAILEKFLSSNCPNGVYTMIAALSAQKEMLNFLIQSQNSVINNLFCQVDSFLNTSNDIFCNSDCHIANLGCMISKLKLDDATDINCTSDVQQLSSLRNSTRNSMEILSMIIKEMKEMNTVMKNLPMLIYNNCQFSGRKIEDNGN